MSVRMNVVMSDELVAAMDEAANSSEMTKSEIFRKAIQLFIAARKGAKDGLKIGLVDPATNELKTEFVGL